MGPEAVTPGRVRLRPLTAADADLLAVEQEDESSFAEPGGRTRDQIVAQVEASPCLDEHGFWEQGIEVEEKLVGTVQVRAAKYAMPPGVCEIGVVVFAAARGGGLGRGAVDAVTDQLLAAGWPRIQAATAVDNLAMQAVLARCGFRFEGVMRAFAPGPEGSREDYQLWAVTAADSPRRTH